MWAWLRTTSPTRRTGALLIDLLQDCARRGEVVLESAVCEPQSYRDHARAVADQVEVVHVIGEGLDRQEVERGAAGGLETAYARDSMLVAVGDAIAASLGEASQCLHSRRLVAPRRLGQVKERRAHFFSGRRRAGEERPAPPPRACDVARAAASPWCKCNQTRPTWHETCFLGSSVRSSRRSYVLMAKEGAMVRSFAAAPSLVCAPLPRHRIPSRARRGWRGSGRPKWSWSPAPRSHGAGPSGAQVKFVVVDSGRAGRSSAARQQVLMVNCTGEMSAAARSGCRRFVTAGGVFCNPRPTTQCIT